MSDCDERSGRATTSTPHPRPLLREARGRNSSEPDYGPGGLPEPAATGYATASAGPHSHYWLIVCHAHPRIGTLTMELAGGREALPVFSSEEEAARFLLWRSSSDADARVRRIRHVGKRELLSVLMGPCRSVEKVALDPLPEVTPEVAVELVGVERQTFVDLLLQGTALFSRRV